MATARTHRPSAPTQGFEHVTAEEVFRQLFERAAIGMALVNLSTRRFLWTNAKLCEITQYSCDELLQRTPVDLTHPDDRNADKTSFERFQRGEVDQRIIEKRYVRKNGTTVWVHITTTVVELGGKKCLFGVTEDISERRRVEEALHDNQEHLRAALADAERAQLALQAADKRKDEFLAMLAHELRNPLASIRNSAAIMRTLPADSVLADVEQIIERQSRHLSRLVDDLLDVARITTGKVRLRKQNLSLTDVLKRAIENLRPLFDNREHELVVEASHEPVRVRGDELRLTQIIDNLLNNAAKYTPHKGRIVVSVQREGDEAVVRVSDNGTGIAPELLPHVFDMFAQANPTLARTESGLGIGLTIAKSLVEMHGGRIAVVSERGRGSTFEVRLPAIDEPVEQRNAHALSSAAPAL
ncbi:MAG TPA: ATP-binding protein, partial [Burkholderiales bacterium]|nr:ATP-binding protein [Burkholderiales bacterium]